MPTYSLAISRIGRSSRDVLRLEWWKPQFGMYRVPQDRCGATRGLASLLGRQVLACFRPRSFGTVDVCSFAAPGAGGSARPRIQHASASVMHSIFKKFNTLGGYIAENIEKIEELQHVRRFSV